MIRYILSALKKIMVGMKHCDVFISTVINANFTIEKCNLKLIEINAWNRIFVLW